MSSKPVPGPKAEAHASLPPTVSENIDTVAEFYAQHAHDASGLQSLIERVALFFGQPIYLAATGLLVAFWMCVNVFAGQLGLAQFDPPPFYLLQGIISFNALIITITVLIRQNRMAALAERHAHLDLQINLFTERKTSKIIEMIEQLRRDMPNVRNRTDSEVTELSESADTKAVLNAIESAQHEPK